MNTYILSINADGNIRLSRKCTPIAIEQPLWSPAISENLKEKRGSKRPAAFILDWDNTKSPRLIVTVSISPKQSGNYKLKGFDTREEKRLIFQSNFSKIDANVNNITELDFMVYDQIDNNIFGRFEGDIHWKLFFYKESNEKLNDIPESYLGATYLEIFWLHGLNSSLFCGGVPVEILRQAAYALRIVEGKSSPTLIPHHIRTKGRFSTDPVVEAIATICFLRNPPRYDIFKKEYHLVTLNEGFNNITFHLHEYLHSIYNPLQRCNCYDMAAIVQVHLKAVGIENVKLGYIDYSQSKEKGRYLKLTTLVGRGLSNIHSFSELNDDMRDHYMVMDEDLIERTAIGSHAFCLFDESWNHTNPSAKKCNGIDEKKHEHRKGNSKPYRIIDACFGPHNGNEYLDEYLTNTFESTKTNSTSLYIYDGITQIDYFPKLYKVARLPHLRSFVKSIITQEGKSSEKKFIVTSWQPWPLLTGLQNLDFTGWDIFYNNIVPGDSEVKQTWKLRKNNEMITIVLHVFSHQSDSQNTSDADQAKQASKAALIRFLTLGTGSTGKELPYKKGPALLGRFSASCTMENYKHYLWTLDNMTISVTGEQTNINIETLCLGLSRHAAQNRKDSLKEHLPSFEGLQKNTVSQLIENKIVLVSKTPKNVFMDCATNDSGLQLFSKEKKTLRLIELEKSPPQKKLKVTVVDKDTLLVNSKDIEINIT